MNNVNNFEVAVESFEGIKIIFLKGFLDAHTAPELEKIIDEIIKSNCYNIIVNFKELDYISSAGLGVFMAFIEEIRNHNGDIKLTEMNNKVFSIFELLGFPVLFDIDEKNEIAIDKFKRGEIKSYE